jgi:FkbM family methyltransferase
MNKNFIKNISYNAFFIKLARFLHLRGILRTMYYYFAKPKNNVLDVTIGGNKAKFFVRNPDELRLAESVSGQWGEKPVIDSFVSLLKKGDAFYDIGANIGIFTVAVANAVGKEGKVIAFEPEKQSITRLKENLGINNLQNVKIIEKALGDENKKTKLYIGGTTGNFSLVNIYDQHADTQEIELVKGDDFVKNNNLPIPTAVKIDVEGYELSVLKGLEETLKNPVCKVICCEVHIGLFPKGITEENIIEFIKLLGFTKIQTFKRAFSAYHIIAQKE